MEASVQHIVIVGGGTAGWLSACVLAARRPDLSVTLVEAPGIPTIGVGEGTWPTMRETLASIGIDEAEFLRETDAAFKQGSQFNGWVDGTAADAYLHPFTAPPPDDMRDLLAAWRSMAPDASFAAAMTPQTRGLFGTSCASPARDARLRRRCELWLSPRCRQVCCAFAAPCDRAPGRRACGCRGDRGNADARWRHRRAQAARPAGCDRRPVHRLLGPCGDPDRRALRQRVGRQIRCVVQRPGSCGSGADAAGCADRGADGRDGPCCRLGLGHCLAHPPRDRLRLCVALHGR